MDPFIILPGRKSVEVWSTKRLTFQPKAWLRELRQGLRLAIRDIEIGSSQLLHATYVSPIREMCDVENILFYNVGTNWFPRLITGLRFERVFADPPTTPQVMNQPALHYHQYELAQRETGFKHWVFDKPIIRWKTSMKTRIVPSLPNQAAHIWYWTKQGLTELITQPHRTPIRFGLRMTIKTPSDSGYNLVTILKPLLDGIVSAFHQHDGTMEAEVSNRVAGILNVPIEKVVAYLRDDTNAVLGKRKLLWKWGDSVQWNPADDCTIAGELLQESTVKDHYEILGELFEPSPIDSSRQATSGR